jgi:hypothetical protein
MYKEKEKKRKKKHREKEMYDLYFMNVFLNDKIARIKKNLIF